MKMQLYKLIDNQKLCWIKVNNREALAIIRSLIAQMQNHTPNTERLESRCSGDCTELSICVDGGEIPE